MAAPSRSSQGQRSSSVRARRRSSWRPRLRREIVAVQERAVERLARRAPSVDFPLPLTPMTMTATAGEAGVAGGGCKRLPWADLEIGLSKGGRSGSRFLPGQAGARTTTMVVDGDPLPPLILFEVDSGKRHESESCWRRILAASFPAMAADPVHSCSPPPMIRARSRQGRGRRRADDTDAVQRPSTPPATRPATAWCSCRRAATA
jgi:hypothetical protein